MRVTEKPAKFKLDPLCAAYLVVEALGGGRVDGDVGEGEARLVGGVAGGAGRPAVLVELLEDQPDRLDEDDPVGLGPADDEAVDGGQLDGDVEAGLPLQLVLNVVRRLPRLLVHACNDLPSGFKFLLAQEGTLLLFILDSLAQTRCTRTLEQRSN